MADTTQTYAVPFHPSALTLASSIVDLQGGQILGVNLDAYANEYEVKIQGNDKVHSEILGHFEWLGPQPQG